MALPRYQAKDIAAKPSSVAVRQASAILGGLVDRIEGFKGMALQGAKFDAEKRAVQEAETAFNNDGVNARTLNENTVYAQTFDSRMRNLYSQKVKLDVSTKAQQLYIDNPDDPANFDKSIEAYRSKYLADIDPAQKTNVDMMFASEKANYGAQINANAVKKLKKAERSTYDEYIASSSNALGHYARQLNDSQARYRANDILSNIDYGLEIGTYTQEEATHLKKTAEFNYLSNTLYGKNDNYIETKNYDAAFKMIDDLKNNVSEQYSVEQRDQMIANMERDLSHAIKQDASRGEKSDRMVHDEAMNYFKAAKNGDVYGNADGVARSNLNDVDRKDFNEWNSLLPELTNFNGLPYATQLETILKYENAGTKEGKDIKRLEAMRGINTKLKQLVNDSPIDAIVMQGYEKEPMQKISSFTPDGMAVLSNRVDLIRTAQKQYGKIGGVFTKGETEYLSEAWVSMDSSEKASLVLGITKNLPTDVARATLGQINKKNADGLLIAGNLTTLGANDVAREVFNGNVILKSEQKGLLPMNLTKDISTNITSILGHTKDANTMNGYSEAIKSVYMSRAVTKGLDPQDGVDNDTLKGAIKDVTGGIIKINGSKVIAPKYGMSEDDAEDWWDSITIQDIANKYGGIGMSDPLAIPDTFKLIKDDGVLVPAGQGKYFVKVGDRFVPNSKGTNLTIVYEDK